MERKLNVSTGAGGVVMIKRTRFDSHISDCPDCLHKLCQVAEQMWRAVCIAALRSQAVTV